MLASVIFADVGAGLPDSSAPPILCAEAPVGAFAFEATGDDLGLSNIKKAGILLGGGSVGVVDDGDADDYYFSIFFVGE